MNTDKKYHKIELVKKGYSNQNLTDNFLSIHKKRKKHTTIESPNTYTGNAKSPNMFM
ncbi:hypothetical protein LR004_02145 [Candidatus Gracilibacteria bacterium]|nr:hypothetical protein [Candidatus Gracilibacteria bacterium]